MSTKSNDPLDQPIFFGEHLELPKRDGEQEPNDHFHVGLEPCRVPKSGIWRIQTSATMSFRDGISEYDIIQQLKSGNNISFSPSLNHTTPRSGAQRGPAPRVLVKPLRVVWADTRGGIRKFYSSMPQETGPYVSGNTYREMVPSFVATTAVNGAPVHEALFVSIGRGSWIARPPGIRPKSFAQFESFHLLKEGDIVTTESGCQLVRAYYVEWIRENRDRATEWFRYMTQDTRKPIKRIELLFDALNMLSKVKSVDPGIEELFQTMVGHTMSSLCRTAPELLVQLQSSTLIPSSFRLSEDWKQGMCMMADHPALLEV